MAIQRWDPLRDLVQLHHRVSRLFEESIARSGGVRSPDEPPPTAWTPAVDLHEDGERYVLRADVPGVEPGEVQLEFDGAEMVLTGRRPPDPAVPRDAYLRVERPSGPFVIRLSVPQGVDRAAVEATQRNGVVQVVLPKRRADDGSSRVVVTAT